MTLKYQKIVRKVAKNTCTYNFLYWCEILATQIRLVCATFLNTFIGNKHWMKKKQVAKVHCNSKMSEFLTSQIIPKHSKQFGLTWIFLSQ